MDNFYQTCPAKMSDGRFLTDYRSNVDIDEQIKYQNGIIRDDEMRLFLQSNANNVLEKEWSKLKKNNSCWKTECIHSYPTLMQPAMFAEQMQKYNNLNNPKHTPSICPPYADYKMTAQNDKK